MKTKLLLYFLVISVIGVSQVTIINNSNLNGFALTSTVGTITKTNLSNQINLYGTYGSSCNIDTVLNLACYDSLKISFTFWRSSPGCSFVNGVITSTTPQTLTIITSNTTNLSIPVSFFWCGVQCISGTNIYIKDLKIIGYCPPTTSCSAAPNQPTIISGNSSVCNSNVYTYCTIPICGVTNYSWTLPSGWTGASSTNTISVVTGSTNGIISVVASNSCGISSPQTINVTVNNLGPPPTPGAITGLNPVCYGVSSTFSVVPVAGATSYSWSVPMCCGGSTSNILNSPNIVNSGNISITAFNVCGSSLPQTLSVTVNKTTISSTNTTNLFCAGESATLTASGANTYSWNTGATSNSIVIGPTALLPIYVVTGTTIPNCITNDYYNVNTTNAPIVNINTSAVSLCVGQAATLTASGASTYTWSNGVIGSNILISPTLTTNYTVTGSNYYGCASSVVQIITVTPLPIITTISSTGILCSGQTATLTVSGANTYAWSSGGNSANEIITPTTTTIYTVNCTDANGCSNSASITQSVSICTGASELNGSANEFIKISPNPSNGLFIIECTKSEFNSDIDVYNALGQVLFSKKINALNISVDLSNYPNGLYYFKVIEDNTHYVYKVIKD